MKAGLIIKMEADLSLFLFCWQNSAMPFESVKELMNQAERKREKGQLTPA